MKNRIDGCKKLDHPLMVNNITREDLNILIDYLKEDEPKLTQGSNVISFEEEWSKWLGVKYSVYVNSGSSANLITLAVLRQIYGEGEIILSPLTWVSDIASCLQNNFSPVFAEINRNTLSLDTHAALGRINRNTKAVFLTHAQGFNGLTDELLQELARKEIPLIEDVCESHGATFRDRKLGSIGLISNFSFYYAHHMSTIEGGMVCTDDDEVYQLLRMYRSHGLVRESSSDIMRERYIRENKNLNPEFIFAFPAYNVRNTEIGAVLGRSQLTRLDENNKKRRRNYHIFLNGLDSDRFRVNFEIEGSCSYAFNIILNEPDIKLRDQLEKVMTQARVEYRRGSSGGGNQLRQPYLKEIVAADEWKNYPEVEHIHHFGWYIGNYPDLQEGKILEICDLLNKA